jgi:DNA-binding NarL/FixJ family response regulator
VEAASHLFLETAERLLGEYTERLVAEMRALGGSTEMPAENELSELSTRELDVLALVAEGLGNEEIAASLHLSVRTVERHLSNIYCKLRVSGKAARAAAAAAAARAALPRAQSVSARIA